MQLVAVPTAPLFVRVTRVADGRFASTEALRADVELGYGVLPAFRGRGFTVRALRLFADWAFGPGGLTRLELGADADNTASSTSGWVSGDGNAVS